MQPLSLVWEWHDGSYDRVHIAQSAQGWSVVGRHGDIRYVLTVNRDLRCIALDASHDGNSLTLTRTPAGWLDAERGLIAGSAGCDDLDLGWSVVTNAFPVKRLKSDDTSTGTFKVLMIKAPDMTVQPVTQSYTHAAANDWHYENTSTGFAATLSFDKTNMVGDYPDLCSLKDIR